MLFLVLLFVFAPVDALNVTENVNNFLSNPCTDKNHIVLAPGVLTAGGTNRACVSRFHPEGPARLLLTLLTEDRQATTASRELPPGDGGCLDIAVPSLPNSKADLIVNIRYPEAQCVWERRLPLRISSGRVLVVQTERARYRPGETVRARVLALKPDLTPDHGLIDEVWLEGPRGAWEGTRVSQWFRLRTRLGLAQLQYQLDELAPPGKWTLRARLGDGSQGSAVFRVGHYELPPFQLSVRHAPKVLRTSERLAWTVCVRYPWSEAVEGMLVIRLRGAGGGGTGVRTAVQLRAPKACHRHAVAAKRVGLHSRNPPDVLVADFSFQEEGTRIWQNTTVVSQVVDKPITLEFLTKHRAVISPGLPYKLKVKANRWDEKPATSEFIRVCRYTSDHSITLPTSEREGKSTPDSCADGQTDSNGVAKVMFAAITDDAHMYRFEAHLKNDSTTTASLIVRVRSGKVQAALGPLKADSRSTRTLVPLYINTHITTPLTVHFVVITRGGIIYRWGATTQCPTSNTADQIHTAPRNGKCNANYYGYSHDVTLPQRDDLATYDDMALKRAKRNVHVTEENVQATESSTKDRFEVPKKLTPIVIPTKGPYGTESTPKIHGLEFELNEKTPEVDHSSKEGSLPRYQQVNLSKELRSTVEPKSDLNGESYPAVVKQNGDDIGGNNGDLYSELNQPNIPARPWYQPKDDSLTQPGYNPHKDWVGRDQITDDIVLKDYTRSPIAQPENYFKLSQKEPTHKEPQQYLKKYYSSLPWGRLTPRYASLPPHIATQYWPNPSHNDVTPVKTDQKHDVTENVTVVTSDALLDRKLKVMLPIKVTHQMCPDSHLIAYFYYNGELVSASKHFEMDECFANKVEATWLNRQAQPGSTVSLQVSTPGPALCALTVLDTAAKWIKPPPTTKELLMNNLRRLIDSHRNLTEYDAAGECFLNTDTPEAPTTSIELTSTWLASAGVRLLGGEAPREAAKRCEIPPAAMTADEALPRSDFSEAWLWRLLPISINGSGIASAQAPDSITRFEAGATCLSRNGIAVSSPAALQIFREFFIHADNPKRLRQGDSSIIRYRIFNYLYEPLSVQIQILADPHIEVPSPLVETACVGARSSVAKRVKIKAKVASPARISLRAKAVNDGNCPNVTSSPTVSDEVVIKIAVDPVGVPVHEQKSILLCGNGSTDFSTSKVEWKWAQTHAVPGTETLTLWTVGDVTGPMLADADSLVLIPRGCGEQNMAQLATNLLALQQLDPTCIAALTAKEHVGRGFTRQLQYVHPSGGFSAFGASDATSSTWLTAFAVRHLRKAHQVLWPNLQVPPALIRAERWLLSQQMENGCFSNEGQVFHRELRGGLIEEGEIASVALTAYVITSLIESTSTLPPATLRNTLACLRALPPAKTTSPTRVYAQALIAYAYMRMEKYEEDLRKTNQVSLLRTAGLEKDEGVRQVMELLKVAKRSEGYVWWEAASLATSIEATSYALLALSSMPPPQRSRLAASAAAAAERWLAAHRSVSGGFVSTQDTLVALEALTAWSSHSPPTHLNVTARSNNLSNTVALQPAMRIPDVLKLSPGDKLTVNVQGTGCALVQATRSYHSLSPPASKDKLLSVQVAVHTDGPFDCDANNTSCNCAAVVEACVMWSSSFPEMALLEVTLPGGYGADARLLYSQLHQPYSLLRRIELSPTNTKATFYLGSRDGSDPSGSGGHQCYNIHAVGPRIKTRAAYAKVMDYYVPTHNDTQFFTIPEECPARISHEAPQYRSSDNLFTKSRSLDGDEILITDEFAFEDIPEGIPLEDPLYDNLTKRKGDERDNSTSIVGTSQFEEVKHVQDVESSSSDVHSEFGVGHSVTSSLKMDDKLKSQGRRANAFAVYSSDAQRSHTDVKGPLINTIPVSSNTDEIKTEEVRDLNVEETTFKAILPEKIISQSSQGVENPNLADFHIIDSEKDLDVPTGVEGPIPTVVLPPKNFVPPPPSDLRRLKTIYTPHGPYYYYNPEIYTSRRYFRPRSARDMLF